MVSKEIYLIEWGWLCWEVAGKCLGSFNNVLTTHFTYKLQRQHRVCISNVTKRFLLCEYKNLITLPFIILVSAKSLPMYDIGDQTNICVEGDTQNHCRPELRRKLWKYMSPTRIHSENDNLLESAQRLFQQVLSYPEDVFYVNRFRSTILGIGVTREMLARCVSGFLQFVGKRTMPRERSRDSTCWQNFFNMIIFLNLQTFNFSTTSSLPPEQQVSLASGILDIEGICLVSG